MFDKWNNISHFTQVVCSENSIFRFLVVLDIFIHGCIPYRLIKFVDTGKDKDKGQRKEKERGESIFNEHSISQHHT